MVQTVEVGAMVISMAISMAINMVTIMDMGDTLMRRDNLCGHLVVHVH